MSSNKPLRVGQCKGHNDNSRGFKPEWPRKYPWVKKTLDGSEIAYFFLLLS